MSTASAPASAPTRSEDILSAKDEQTDLALSNGLVKAGTGLAVGIVASALLFRRRPWPVFLGLGFGIGQGYADAERVFNPAAVPGFKIAEETKASPFTLHSPFTPAASVPSPSSPAPSVPAPSPASSSPAPSPSPVVPAAKSAASSISSKVSEAVAEAKQKASSHADVAVEKSEEIGAKVKAEGKKVDDKVTSVTEGKKWV
ncbi:hypothetical protein JCM8547_007459 [Rhodosporidiobolus lusitaniae]